MRIASLSPVVTEILFALEQQKKIVCRDKNSDFPDGTKMIPVLPEHQKIDPRDLRECKPDVVFTSGLAQKTLAESLRTDRFGVVHLDPQTLAEILVSIRDIGTLLDCQPRAEALLATMQQGFNDTKRKAGLFSRRPKVYIEDCSHPPTASGNWVPEVVKLAGGISLQAVSGERIEVSSQGRQVSLAEMQAFDADLIVLSIRGMGSAASKDLLTARDGWNDLRAVRENHVFVIDDALLNRPGPRLVEGTKRIFGWCFQVMH